MRRHGWQLPYHALQVVAIAVFLALGFAFYVFFAPFVGKKLFQHVVIGLYTPLVTCVFCLYIWCAATDPADPGVFKSKKYRKADDAKQAHPKECKPIDSGSELRVGSASEKRENERIGNAATSEKSWNEPEDKYLSCGNTSFSACVWMLLPLSFLCARCISNEQSSEQQMSEDGAFFCSLCEVEVLKYSKHCRVCDKCVDGFDHHCRWLNNCIGRRNYRRFFILMVSALLMLILQWSVGILVLVLCFLERKKFSVEIVSKLGSSFSLVPFVIVVVSCTFLAMVATLPIAQLFSFHILLIKKGISTYDYIIALREQDEQDVGDQQSPRMSRASSFAGLSSASSVAAFNRGAWCTPPRLFLEDQFDVIPSEIGTLHSSSTKKNCEEEGIRKKGAGTVKISPWTLARLNAEEVSKAAAQARKKSRVLQPMMKRRGMLPADLSLEPVARISASATDSTDASARFTPLQLEARSAFQPSGTASSSNAVASPESSLDSPDLHPLRVSSSGPEEVHKLASLGISTLKGIHRSMSTSDGYEASGGEDSDRVPTRIVHRSSNWPNAMLSSGAGMITVDLKASSSGAALCHKYKL